MPGIDESPESSRFRFFAKTEVDPWAWIPDHWLQPGTVFYLARDHRFYEMVKKSETGWYCEEIPGSRVGKPEHIDRIINARRAYDHSVTARRELAVKAGQLGETPEIAQFIQQRDDERRRLQEELIQLCNPKDVPASTRGVDWDRVKLYAAPVLVIAQVLALVYCVVRLFELEPEQAGTWLLQGIIALVAAVLLGISAVVLYRKRDKLPLAQLVGCGGLAVLVITALAAIVFFFFNVMRRPQ